MKRNGVGFRLAQGSTLAFAAAVLGLVVVQAQGGCQGEVTATPDPTGEESPTGHAGAGTHAPGETTAEAATPTAEAAALDTNPAASAAAGAAAAKPTAAPAGKPRAKNPAPNLEPEGTFFPSSKAGPMPRLINEPQPQQVQK